MTTERRIAVALRIDEYVPHHQEVLSGVLDYARRHPEWHCVIDEHPSFSHARRDQSTPAYDGVIARATPVLQRRLAKLGIPLVNVWYQHARPATPGVYPDVVGIGRLAAEHVLERGFRALAFVGCKGFRRDHDIGQAFVGVAADRGLPHIVNDCSDPNFGDRSEWLALRRNMEELLRTVPRPVGILAALPSVARAIVTMCHEHDRWDARHVGVVCLDNVKSVVELSPQITAIDSNYFRIGHTAAEMLEHLMDGKTPPNPVRLIPPKGVIPRESTDFFAVDDDLVADALRYISTHLRRPLGIDEIAKSVATSPRSLQRRFEAAMGCPVSDEVRRLRVELAKRLLVKDEISIDEVASEAGFSSADVMNRCFHRHVSMSPSDYRKHVRGTRSP